MKGLELSEKFYLEFGEPMIHSQFSELEAVIAVGLAGSGSECFGYDDELSRDHDFEPGFCIFLPDEDTVDSRSAFLLERAYSRLPKEYMGFKRSSMNPVGGNRHGVIRMGDFFKEKTGCEDGNLTLSDWFTVPEQMLSEAVNGKIFRDDLGVFTAIRKKLEYLPNDVRLKKIAGNLLVMAQSGQYNYRRCISRGETGAAQLALIEFVKSSMNVVFLLSKRYIPYYKWIFHALNYLPCLTWLSDSFEYLISSGNENDELSKKEATVDRIIVDIIAELTVQQLTRFTGTELEGHAYSVNDRIADGEIRNLNVMCAV